VVAVAVQGIDALRAHYSRAILGNWFEARHHPVLAASVTDRGLSILHNRPGR
jgi:hypothetical protein